MTSSANSNQAPFEAVCSELRCLFRHICQNILVKLYGNCFSFRHQAREAEPKDYNLNRNDTRDLSKATYSRIGNVTDGVGFERDKILQVVKITNLIIQSNFNGSNIFGTIENCLRHGWF